VFFSEKGTSRQILKFGDKKLELIQAGKELFVQNTMIADG